MARPRGVQERGKFAVSNAHMKLAELSDAQLARESAFAS